MLLSSITVYLTRCVYSDIKNSFCQRPENKKRTEGSVKLYKNSAFN
jgi:hypothetical protein